MWGVWRQSDGTGPFNVNPGTGSAADAACTTNVSVCVEYDDPSGLMPATLSDYDDDLMAACEGLTLSEVQGLNISGTIPGGAGWDLVDHFCTTGDLSVSGYRGPHNELPAAQAQTFSRLVSTSGASCDNEWTYDNSCAVAECPISGGGTGSTSGADGGGSSSGGAGAYDCSDFTSSNVSWSTTSGNNRDALVRGPIANLLRSEPYTALYHCAEATIAGSNGKIHYVASGSILTHLGIVSNDVLASVNGESGSVQAMIDEIIDDLNHGNDSTLVIDRATKSGTDTYTYTVEWGS